MSSTCNTGKKTHQFARIFSRNFISYILLPLILGFHEWIRYFFTSLKSHSSFNFLGNVTGFQIFHIVCCSAYFVLTRCASPEEFHENNLFATKSSRHGSVGKASVSVWIPVSSPTNVCSQVCGREWFGYHAGHQEVSRCCTIGESCRMCNIYTSVKRQ